MLCLLPSRLTLSSRFFYTRATQKMRHAICSCTVCVAVVVAAFLCFNSASKAQQHQRGSAARRLAGNVPSLCHDMSRMSPFQGLGTRQASARHCFCRFPGSQGFTASFDTRGLGSGRVRLEHRSSKVSSTCSTCPILLLMPRIFEAKQSTVLRFKVVKLINARSISGMLGLRWCWNAIPS